MPSSLPTLGLMVIFFLIASTFQLTRQDDSSVLIQGPLQQLDPQISPRISDSTATEDSYIVALRESQRNRNKGSASAIEQHHHEEKHHHDCSPNFVEDANEQFNGQHHLIQVLPTYEHVSTRPLTAMEKNYLRPHRPQPIEQPTVPNPQVDEAEQQPVDVPNEEESETEVTETNASNEILILAPMPHFSDDRESDPNTIFSAYSSNTGRIANKKKQSIKKNLSDINSKYSAYSSAPVVSNKPPSAKKNFETVDGTTVKNNSEKPQEIRKPIKQTIQMRVPGVVSAMTSRAANVVRNGMKTVGSTIGIPMVNSLIGSVNTALFPIVAALGRKKRSIPAEGTESWKKKIQKAGIRTLGYVDFLSKLMNKPLQSAANINKLLNSNNRPLWSHLTRSTDSPPDTTTTTKVHSIVKRSKNSKIQKLKATNLKYVIPWLNSAFSIRNKNKKVENRMTKYVKEGNILLKEPEVKDESLSSASEDSPSIDYDDYQSDDNEIQMEENVEVHVLPDEEETENSTLMHESSFEYSDQSEETDLLKEDEQQTVNLVKYTHGHGIIVPPVKYSISDETLKYTHGHGIIVPTKIETNLNYDEDITKYTHGHGIIVPNPQSGDSASSSLVSDTINNQNILTDFLNSNFSSVAMNDGLYITTGIYEDEVDLVLDDLQSLLSDIIIAPLPGVEAVVAEENDAIIVESEADENQPASVPVVSNLANILIASSGSSSSSSSSSSSDTGVSTSSTGVTIDLFASLYTFGLAAIGIFVLSLPIWIPIVVARMKKRWNKSIGYRLDSQLLDRYKEFNPFSILMRNLMTSEEPFSDPGPLNSEEVYGPAISNFADRRKRRQIREKIPQHKR